MSHLDDVNEAWDTLQECRQVVEALEAGERRIGREVATRQWVHAYASESAARRRYEDAVRNLPSYREA